MMTNTNNTNTETETEATCLNLTLADIRNADWEVCDSDSEGELPNVYKAYEGTVKGHVIRLAYSDYAGYGLTVDGHRADIDDLFVDDEQEFDDTVYRVTFDEFGLVDVLDELTGELLTDLDDLYKKAEWYEADEVGTTDVDDSEWDLSVEVRQKEDGTYIAKRTDEDGEEYIDDYDYQNVLDYQRNAIRGFLKDYAEDLIEQEAHGRKYTVDEAKLDEVLADETNHACEEYAEYALQYYYFDSEGIDRTKDGKHHSGSGDPNREALVAFCLGGDEDERILACVTFEEEDEDEDEE